MNTFAVAISASCWVWILYFLITNAVFFQDLATSLFNDKKGGLPFVGIGIPLLLAACSVFLLGRQQIPEGMALRNVVTLPHQIPARVQVLARCTLSWCQAPKSDPNFNWLAFFFVFLPSLKYLVSNIQRHLKSIDSTSPDSVEIAVGEIADAFGMVAVIIMSVFLLIPATKHSALLEVMGWDPINAIRLHIWAGRLLIIVSTIHGILYMCQWKFLQGESIFRLLIPPAGCWTLRETGFTPTCRNITCSCYQIFRNFTGFLAFVALITIGITSRDKVRRKSFSLFYKMHILSSPLAFLMVIFHYKRSMPYLAGGILYYLASSFPIWVENYLVRRQGGTKILSVERISSNDDVRPCTVLIVEASDSALSRYRAGQYVRLHAPWISKAMSHPFTINPMPGQANQFCIIFRSTGKFTKQLAQSLIDGSVCLSNKIDNRLHDSLIIDGFYGSSGRLRQVLQHDVVVFVAGGVGITPFLTLLHKIYQSLSASNGGSITRKVVLHWICREEGLVRYIHETFFNPLLNYGKSVGFTLTLVIHVTGTSDLSVDPGSFEQKSGIMMNNEQFPSSSGGGLQEIEDDTIPENRIPRLSGVPFTPSRFTPMSKRVYKSNLLPFASFAISSLIGLCIVWYFYKYVQNDGVMSTRIFSPLLVLLLTFTIGAAANLTKNYNIWLDPEEDFLAVPSTCTANEKHDVESFEMSEKLGNHTETEEPYDHNNGHAIPYSTISLEVSKGRPDFNRLLRCLDQGTRPGLFICGPESLVDSVRQTIGKTSRCGRDRVSCYEESFIL